jgi:hypothetical protein
MNEDRDRNEQGRHGEPNPRAEAHQDPSPPPRGTSSPAVGGSKTAPGPAGAESTRTDPNREPPGNAGGETTNNPDVGPGA